jgi:hypothetical protein
MAKSPRDRYPSATEFAHAARRALDEPAKKAALRVVEPAGPSRARPEPTGDADSVTELLRRDDVRLVTLTDSHGAAETRLAIESPCAASAPRCGRVLLIVEDIDPLAAMRALATPDVTMTSKLRRCGRG